jgi:hypothetical protein
MLIYLLFMYVVYGRENLLNIEMSGVMFICALPGFGIYKLLQRRPLNQQMQA